MDENEGIFPEKPSVVAESAPVEGNIKRVHEAITKYCWTARKREESLQQELAERHNRLLSADELHQYVHDKWPLHILDWFSRNKALLEEVDRSSKGMMPSALRLILKEATEEADELKKRYSSWMDTTAAKLKFKPDPVSRHPKYKFEDGFFTVVVSEPSFTARVEDLAGPLVDRMPADPDAVVSYLLQEKARIFGRPFDAAAFLQRLLRTYVAIVEKDPELKVGEAVPIRHITGRLRDNEKAFHNDEFLVDLTKLLDSHVSDIDGWKWSLEQTKEIERGLYVFPKYGKGYVGFLRFTRRD